MNTIRLISLQAILLFFCSTSAIFATSHAITTVGTTFSPNTLTITVGDTVVWSNGGGTHNVNGTTATFPSNPQSFGGFAPSSSTGWPFTHVFTAVGSYNYQCDLHAGGGMTGSITVNAAPATSGPCGDLFFSEYIEGSGNNKAVEIYNPTTSSVNLDDYVVVRQNGGSSSTDTTHLTGTLAAGDVYIIANSNAAPYILSLADTTGTLTFYNGDDALRLINTSTNMIIDQFGETGFDPGTNWAITGTNGVNGATSEFTLVRDPSVNVGDPSWNTVVINQWAVYPQNDYNSLGFHNANSCGSIPAYFINQLKGVDANVTPDSLGVLAQITGRVLNPDMGFNSSEFAIQDQTAGIWVTGADPIIGYSGAEEGDVVRVFGTVAFSNGVIRFTADSINELYDTLNLPAMEKVSLLDEYSEGRYVRLDSVRIINNLQDSFDINGSGQSYTIVTQQLDTFEMRVDRDLELAFEGNPVPTGLFNIIGVGSQFDGSAPHNSNYQIFPARYSDLEVLTVTGAAISFTEATASILETGGSYQIMITIGDTVTGGATIDVENTGNGTASFGTDFTFNDTTLTFSGTSLDTFMLNIGVIDNLNVNPDRTVELALRNITGGGLYGLDTVFTLTIINDDIPTYTIAQIRGNDNLGGTSNVGIADSLGVVCRTFGIVTSPDIGGSNLSVTVEDGTHGITLFQLGSATPPTLVPGDSVEIVGTVGAFNGLSEMINNTVINVISSGNALPTPLTVDSIGEFTESRLIRMNNMSFVDASQWPSAPGGSFNINITNGIDTFVLRVDSDLPLINQVTPPAAPFDVIGFGGQFDSSDPYTTGYQIFAIDSAGFIPSAIAPLPTYAIGSVDGINASGVADSIGVECKLIGIAHGENFRAAAGGLEFTLIDGTNANDGIAVFSSTSLGYTLAEGDELRIIGKIDQVLGLTRIVADSIAVISSGNSLAAAAIVSSLDETTESKLVRLNDVSYIAEGAWTGTGASFNVRFANSTDTFTVRIDNDCDLYSASEPNPGSTFTVIGIGSQLDPLSPFDEGYFLLPRRSTDLIETAVGGPIAAFTFSVNQGKVTFTDASTNGPTQWIWNFGDGFSGLNQNPIHIYTASGTYNVCLTVSNVNGSNTFCDNVNVTVSGLEDVFAQSIKVFPNPAKGELFINNENGIISEIVIYNILGKVEKSIETNSSQVKVDLTGMNSGQYILKVRENEKVTSTQIFITE